MTKSTIEWTELATWQLDQAHNYIALSNSTEVADRITARIVASIQQLATFPMAGRSGRVSGYSRTRDFEYTLHRSLRHRS